MSEAQSSFKMDVLGEYLMGVYYLFINVRCSNLTKRDVLPFSPFLPAARYPMNCLLLFLILWKVVNWMSLLLN
jgi:hypothetical protein